MSALSTKDCVLLWFLNARPTNRRSVRTLQFLRRPWYVSLPGCKIDASWPVTRIKFCHYKVASLSQIVSIHESSIPKAAHRAVILKSLARRILQGPVDARSPKGWVLNWSLNARWAKHRFSWCSFITRWHDQTWYVLRALMTATSTSCGALSWFLNC